MTVVASDVQAVAPEYGSTDTNLISKFVGFAGLQVDPAVWGTLADMAQTYLAAHFLAISYPGGSAVGAASSPGGPLTDEKVGDVSRSFASFTPKDLYVGDVDLMSTGYGRLFLNLRSCLGITPLVTGTPPSAPEVQTHVNSFGQVIF